MNEFEESNIYLEKLKSLAESPKNVLIATLILNLALTFSMFWFQQYKNARPQASVGLSETSDEVYVVEVAGAVVSPGVYEVSSHARVSTALSLAGGLSGTADEEWVAHSLNLSQKLADSQKIYIPFVWEGTEQAATIERLEFVPVSAAPLAGEASDTTAQTINVNTATDEELQTLPGIGPAYSEKMLKGRPYADLNDFIDRSGVSLAKVEKFQDDISF